MAASLRPIVFDNEPNRKLRLRSHQPVAQLTVEAASATLRETGAARRKLRFKQQARVFTPNSFEIHSHLLEGARYVE